MDGHGPSKEANGATYVCHVGREVPLVPLHRPSFSFSPVPMTGVGHVCMVPVLCSAAPSMEAPAFSFHKFVQFALEEAGLHAALSPVPSLDKFRCMKSKDQKTTLRALSYQAPKIRLLRSFSVDGSHAMQVLDFAVFSKPEFDLPIFCANFFTTPRLGIVVLDLNPLYNINEKANYKDKYYNQLLPLGQKYAKLFPWGKEITSESLQFFSPIVVWSKFTFSMNMHELLYSAFVDYFKAWLNLMDEAKQENDEANILRNRVAQHRYLTWRAQKDPGRPILQNLVGRCYAEDIVRNLLFDGVDYLRAETFLDYFPEYQCEDGSVNPKRSVAGKSFETRPWDERGNFINQA